MYYPTIYGKHGHLSEFGVIALPGAVDPIDVDHWGITLSRAGVGRDGKTVFALLIGANSCYFGAYTLMEKVFGPGHRYNADRHGRPCEIFVAYKCDRAARLPSYEEMEQMFFSDTRSDALRLVEKKWKQLRPIDTYTEEYRRDFSFRGVEHSHTRHTNEDRRTTAVFQASDAKEVWNEVVAYSATVPRQPRSYCWTIVNCPRIVNPIYRPDGLRADFVLNICAEGITKAAHMPALPNGHPQASGRPLIFPPEPPKARQQDVSTPTDKPPEAEELGQGQTSSEPPSDFLTATAEVQRAFLSLWLSLYGRKKD